MRFVKNRAYYGKLETIEIHSFSDQANFATSRAVFTLLKFGYFSLFRLRTRVVKPRDNEEQPRHVLVVQLKRTANFDSLFETYREEGQALYKKRLEAEAAEAAAKSTAEETKEGGEATDPPSNDLQAEASEEDNRSLDDKGKWWLKGVPKEDLQAIENMDEPEVYL